MKQLLSLFVLLPFVAFGATTTVTVGVTFVDTTTINAEEQIVEVSEKQESTVSIEDDTITVVYQ